MTSRGTSRRSAAFEDNFDIKFSLALGNLSGEPRESAGTRGLKTDGAWPSCWATHGQNGVRVLLGAGNSSRHQPQSRPGRQNRSEEHTSELQSPDHTVCSLVVEKTERKQ